MEDNDIFISMGKFEAKIDALEKTVERLEGCVEKLTLAMANSKNGWQLLMSFSAVSAILGSVAHKPIELILGLFK